ncbi:MAG TPA: hypothetical protein VGH11_18525 [Jatrophihabitans sp.]
MFEPSGSIRQSVFEREAEIFLHSYGVSGDDHIAEFAPYESASTFVAVLDDLDDVLGVMRIIKPGPAGLKTINESCGQPWNIDGPRAARAVGLEESSTWDVATVGVPRGAGRHRFAVTAALYHGLVLSARQNGVRSLVMTLDERVRTILTATGLITTAFPGARPGPFCGSKASTPVFGHCDAMLDAQRRLNPDAYRLIVQGVGLDAISVPARQSFILGRSDAERVSPDLDLVGPGVAV